jgi:hypothetical protein
MNLEEPKTEVKENLPEAVPTEVTLFGQGDPGSIIVRMGSVARALADVIDQQKLWVDIQGKRYVLAEGWTTLGGLLNLSPSTVWTRKMEQEVVETWEARVEVFQGVQLRGAAEAMCSRSEPRWKAQPSYAIRSMAQTRAMSKALRLPLGFIMKIAGYEATPADEMDGVRVATDAGALSTVYTSRAGDTPPAEYATITHDQACDIDALLAEIKGNRRGFLDWLGVKSVQGIAAVDYQRAVKALERKRDEA